MGINNKEGNHKMTNPNPYETLEKLTNRLADLVIELKNVAIVLEKTRQQIDPWSCNFQDLEIGAPGESEEAGPLDNAGCKKCER
jgi:hypothetical protein